jgi:hypothetical protein
MRNRLYLVVLALLACGGGEQLPDPSFSAPAALIIQDAETDGRGEATVGSAKGPLFVDVHSFDRLGRATTGKETISAALRKAVGTDFVESGNEQAIQCSLARPQDPCLVAEHGVFIQLDSLVKTDSSFEALVSSYTTQQRHGSDHSAICRRQRLLRLRPAGSGWLIQARQLVRTC